MIVELKLQLEHMRKKFMVTYNMFVCNDTICQMTGEIHTYSNYTELTLNNFPSNCT